MSWGIRITVLYLGFMALILTLVFTCMGNKSELESKDYYARELKFQDQLDATNNANALQKPIDYVIRERSVQLIFPQEILSADFSGEVNFIRPSDSSKDKKITLKPGAEGMQMIDPGFAKGVYKMQVVVKSKGKSYFKEATLTFQ